MVWRNFDRHGTGDFDFDPVYDQSTQQTAAEMSPELKQQLSHRGKRGKPCGIFGNVSPLEVVRRDNQHAANSECQIGCGLLTQRLNSANSSSSGPNAYRFRRPSQACLES